MYQLRHRRHRERLELRHLLPDRERRELLYRIHHARLEPSRLLLGEVRRRVRVRPLRGRRLLISPMAWLEEKVPHLRRRVRRRRVRVRPLVALRGVPQDLHLLALPVPHWVVPWVVRWVDGPVGRLAIYCPRKLNPCRTSLLCRKNSARHIPRAHQSQFECVPKIGRLETVVLGVLIVILLFMAIAQFMGPGRNAWMGKL